MKGHNAGGKTQRVLDKIQEEANTQLHAQRLLLAEESSITIGRAAKNAAEMFSGWQ
jgi:hypothetical protein